MKHKVIKVLRTLTQIQNYILETLPYDYKQFSLNGVIKIHLTHPVGESIHLRFMER